MPANNEELDYHQRLQASRPIAAIAAAQVCEHYLPELVELLARKVRYASSDDISDAAEDAVLDYVRQPTKYDPTKKSLRSYLYMAAYRDLLNKLQQNQRSAALSLDVVGFAEVLRNKDIQSDEIIDQLTAAELSAQALAVATDEQERIVIHLMLEGVREHTSYAAALGLSHLPLAQQRAAVNRFKEKMRLRIKRSRQQKRSHL